MNCKQGLVIAAVTVSASLFARQADERWLRDAALQRSLSAPVATQSANISLREFLNGLSRSQRVAYFLDRRLDPSKLRDLPRRDLSLRSTFFSVADQAHAGTAMIGDVVYIGPSEVAAALPDALTKLRADQKNLPAEAKKIWQRSHRLKSGRLSRPAQLIDGLARENGLEVVGLNSIEHDLWPELDLPPLTLAERFACLCIGFGKWPRISAHGKSLQIVDFPLPAEITRTYNVAQRAEFAAWLRDQVPGASIQSKSAGVVVTASPADQHAAARWIVQHETVAKLAPGARKVVTLNVTSSVGNIARQVASTLGVEFQCEDRLEERLQQRVEIHVDKVTYEELLSRVFADTGLTFELDERQLRVFAK